MISLAPGTKVFLACRPIDMRSGFNGLAAKAQQGVPPAPLRFYTVAYCTPSCPPRFSVPTPSPPRPFKAAWAVLHATLTPRIAALFMACNMAA